MDGSNGKITMILSYQFTCTTPNSSGTVANEQFILLILYILFFISCILSWKNSFKKREGFLKLISHPVHRIKYNKTQKKVDLVELYFFILLDDFNIIKFQIILSCQGLKNKCSLIKDKFFPLKRN